ncbi:MAG: cobalamin-independent methionine synthase II family protein [Chloroflexi bacterium]|nr:cobalamin-independent methionine synthase II family protein [Chloroflexota bacterium]
MLTTHCGSLPRPDDLVLLLAAEERGRGDTVDHDLLRQHVAASVADVVQRQVSAGLDVINDGEHSKMSFTTYTASRLGGLERSASQSGERAPTRDALQFPAVYEEMRVMYAARPSNVRKQRSRPSLACTGPITYTGQARVQADIDNLKRAMQTIGASDGEGFLTALSPTNVAPHYPNLYYRTEEEYLVAIADAMHEEYTAIVEAGFILQIDDPRLATYYDRSPGLNIEDCRKFIASSVEVVNHALRGIPEDRVRFHTCYSTNVAPRVNDLELKHFIDLMLGIRAGGYSFEAANPRHEHEWQVWEDVRLPQDKVLIPGVVSHCITLVEHPELVAQRIERFASVVGRERVLASNDCGFATSAAGDEVHPDVAWAKTRALCDGARLASQRLWAR